MPTLIFLWKKGLLLGSTISHLQLLENTRQNTYKKRFHWYCVFLNPPAIKIVFKWSRKAQAVNRGCIFLTTDHQMYNKQWTLGGNKAEKVSDLNSDTAGKTEEVMTTIVLIYRSWSVLFARKTLAGISSHTHTLTHTNHTVCICAQRVYSSKLTITSNCHKKYEQIGNFFPRHNHRQQWE